MRVWNSLLAAIGMYTKIPVKKVDWSGQGICYLLCFVPFAGLIIGGLQYGLWFLCHVLRAGNFLFACIACGSSLMVTGGIHLAGFCKTVDALASCRVKKKRLEILFAPQPGVYAVIGCAAYLLLLAGFFGTAVSGMTVIVMGAAAVLARCVGCLMAVFLRGIGGGDVRQPAFAAADKPVTAAVLAFELILVCGAAIWLDALSSMLMLLGISLGAIYCVTAAMRQFGGMCEELLGFSIQVMELCGIAMAAFGGLLWNL